MKDMSKLVKYLNHLDGNADAREAHNTDAKAAMRNFGLSQEEQDAMHSGDKTRVAAVAGLSSEELPSPEVTHFALE